MPKDPNQKEYSKLRREYYNNYQTQIVPIVQQFENERKIKLRNFIITTIICYLIGFVLLYFGYITGGFMGESDKRIIPIGGTLLIIPILDWVGTKKSFENSIKEKIMPIVCQCFGNMKWTNGIYYEGICFTRAGVIPQFSFDIYDDIFEGSYKDVDFEILESTYISRSGKRERIAFDGVIVKLKMNKKFSSHTIIKPIDILHKSTFEHFKHTKLEDTEFNKKFDVFTNDEIDARYLITPTFMERLKNMKTAFNANAVSCAFYKNHLIIALSTPKDLFSLCSLVKPIDDKKQYLEMYEEIVSIIKLIDHFKLNERIGL